MPIDNSNSQSFRTHRLRCKAIAGGPPAMRLSNEQTVPESTFVDYKLGRTPYLVQPSSGGPATVDAGCCGSSCPNVYCNVIIQALSTSLSDYNADRLIYPILPEVPGFANSVIRITMFGCNQQFNITGLSSDPDGLITFSDINVVTGITGLFPFPPEFPQTVDFIIIFPTSSVTVDEQITVTGTIEPCGLPIMIASDGP